MKKIFLLPLVLMVYGCQYPNLHKDIEQKSNIMPNQNFNHVSSKDSIKRAKVYELYEGLNGKRYWKNANKASDIIDISISTEPAIYLFHDIGESNNIFKVVDVKNYIDSLIFTTTNYSEDTTYVWLFYKIDNFKGKWIFYKPQTKQYKDIGIYKIYEK